MKRSDLPRELGKATHYERPSITLASKMLTTNPTRDVWKLAVFREQRQGVVWVPRVRPSWSPLLPLLGRQPVRSARTLGTGCRFHGGSSVKRPAGHPCTKHASDAPSNPNTTQSKRAKQCAAGLAGASGLCATPLRTALTTTATCRGRMQGRH